MTELEKTNFYKADELKYIPKKNEEFMSWVKGLNRKGVIFHVDLKEIDSLIATLSGWYIVKYSDSKLYEEGNGVVSKNNELCDEMTMDQLKKRLSINENRILECTPRVKYARYKLVSGVGKNIDLIISFRLQSELRMTNIIIKNIQDTEILNVLKERQNVDTYELLDILKDHSAYVNGDLDELVDNTNFEKYDKVLREKVVKMAALRLLYYKNTELDYGVYRAKKLISCINKCYKTDISDEFIDEIINRDYTKEPIIKKENDVNILMKKIGKFRKYC